MERLHHNLAGFESRYRVETCAVGVDTGEASFGYEPTGRYGGLGRRTGASMRVWCRAAAEVVAEVTEQHGEIDILKVDIDSLEREVVDSIPRQLKSLIRTILIEQKYRANPYPDLYRLRQEGPIARFERRSPAPE